MNEEEAFRTLHILPEPYDDFTKTIILQGSDGDWYRIHNRLVGAVEAINEDGTPKHDWFYCSHPTSIYDSDHSFYRQQLSLYIWLKRHADVVKDQYIIQFTNGSYIHLRFPQRPMLPPLYS